MVRIFGDDPIVVVPETVAGKQVTGLSDYMFSEKEPSEVDSFLLCEQSKTSCRRAEISDHVPEGLMALAGDRIEEVRLPKSVTKIGDLCFYGCRNIRSIDLENPNPEIGSDAFMNCHRLKYFRLEARATDKTVIRRILLTRTEETYVRFNDAAAYFPAYSEHYDLIGPAHIFELNIDGQGLRARQCFSEDVFLPEAYDEMFSTAVTNENPVTLCRMAASRLACEGTSSPGEEARHMYETYVVDHMDILCRDAVENRDLTLIISLAERGVTDRSHIKQCLSFTTAEGWVEGTRELLGLTIG